MPMTGSRQTTIDQGDTDQAGVTRDGDLHQQRDGGCQQHGCGRATDVAGAEQDVVRRQMGGNEPERGHKARIDGPARGIRRADPEAEQILRQDDQHAVAGEDQDESDPRTAQEDGPKLARVLHSKSCRSGRERCAETTNQRMPVRDQQEGDGVEGHHRRPEHAPDQDAVGRPKEEAGDREQKVPGAEAAQLAQRLPADMTDCPPQGRMGPVCGEGESDQLQHPPTTKAAATTTRSTCPLSNSTMMITTSSTQPLALIRASRS